MQVEDTYMYEFPKIKAAKYRRAQGDVCLANYYRPSLQSDVKLQGGPSGLLSRAPSTTKPTVLTEIAEPSKPVERGP